MTSPALELPPDDREEAELASVVASLARSDRRRRWLGRAMGSLLAVVLLGAVWLWQRDALADLTREVQARLQDQPGAGVDLRAIHAELLPAWVVDHGAVGGDPARRMRDLKREVQADPVLSGLVAELADRTRDPRRMVEQGLQPFVPLVDQWNRYLEPAGWRIEATMHGNQDRPQLVLKTYRIQARVPVRVGPTPVTALVLARADRLGVTESMLGHANPASDRAILLSDRITDAALEDVWPLLDPALDAAQPPRFRAFAPLVRREVAAAIPAEMLRILASTARLRFDLERVRRDVDSRHACGSEFRLYRVPWRGLDPSTFQGLLAWTDTDDDCPGLRQDEARTLIDASRALTSTPDLEPAVGHLVAWLSRGVIVHETRHVADQVQRKGLEVRLPCDACGAELGVGARAELSAYTATLAWPDQAATTLLHICQIRDLGGDTGQAVAFLLAALGPRACEEPPTDLAARARTLEQQWFGRSERVAWPTDLPRQLPLPK